MTTIEPGVLAVVEASPYSRERGFPRAYCYSWRSGSGTHPEREAVVALEDEDGVVWIYGGRLGGGYQKRLNMAKVCLESYLNVEGKSSVQLLREHCRDFSAWSEEAPLVNSILAHRGHYTPEGPLVFTRDEDLYADFDPEAGF